MTLQHAEWGMSAARFDQDWPPATRHGDGAYHFGPAGDPIGYGVALTSAIAERERQKIRAAGVAKARGLIWC